MTVAKDIAKLQVLTQLLLDAKLQALRQATEDRDRSLMQREALNVAEDPGSLPVAVAASVSLTYSRWADQRRAELNSVIARQTVACMAARAEASIAFGKVQALQAALDRQAKR